MKLLSGTELAGFIKERQAKAVRGLRQAYGVQPRLAIIVTVDDPVIEIYIRLKERYGTDILVDVDIYRVQQEEVEKLIIILNADHNVHGIIIQLPLQDPSQSDALLQLVYPKKDVDALGAKPAYDPATPTAILWLLAGFGINLVDHRVALVGTGKLVGKPLFKMLTDSGIEVVTFNKESELEGMLMDSGVIITATGQPGLISSEMIPLNAVVVDAGVAVEQGVAKGDLAASVYLRDDLKITPQKGGVGPLTVCALFENVIKSAKSTAGIKVN